MWGAAEKANKNRASKAWRKEAGFQKPSQADESTVRDIRRCEVFAEEDPRLWTAKRRKFHGKYRNALAMRVHTCPIHPNWVNSSEALYDLTRFARSQIWVGNFGGLNLLRFAKCRYRWCEIGCDSSRLALFVANRLLQSRIVTLEIYSF